MLRYLILILITALTANARAQSDSSPKKGRGKNQPAMNEGQPSSLQPYYPSKNYEPEKKKENKKSSGKVTYDARERFYERMEQVAKAHRKAEKELAKPQYSDPSYFGHKRPPKKRPPEKMKFCKVCGIRH